MYKGIIAYSAKEWGNSIEVTKCYNNQEETKLFTTWNELAYFLTEDKGQAFHIVWNLKQFSKAIFKLIPNNIRIGLKDSPRIMYDNCKIFSVERMLGITLNTHLKGNIYDRHENNFYGIHNWLSKQEEPKTNKELKILGEQLIEALEILKIYPSKLTSPVGAFEESLQKSDFPTIFSNETDIFLEACNYALPMMDFEWRQDFNNPNNNKIYHYDITAAYLSFILNLPNTNRCNISHSTKYDISADWGIMKGKVIINSSVSPIACRLNGEYTFPKGEWNTYLTNEEWLWLWRNGIGSFKMEDGFFFKFNSIEKPYEEMSLHLFNLRQNTNIIAQEIARRIAQGLSGKLDQTNQDESFGELYNPIYAAMVRSRCRLTVAEFIFKNTLVHDLINITVDGVKTTKQVHLENTLGLGYWRENK